MSRKAASMWGSRRSCWSWTPGSRKGETVEAVSSSSYLYGAHCRPGMRVIAAVNESGEELYVTVYSQDGAWYFTGS